jgi:hypothetical protein
MTLSGPRPYDQKQGEVNLSSHTTRHGRLPRAPATISPGGSRAQACNEATNPIASIATTSQCGLVGLAGTDVDRVIERMERFSGLMLGSLLRGYAFGDAFPNFRRSKANYLIRKTALRTAN